MTAVEFAVIAPSLLLLIWLVLQGAFYYWGQSVALQAAREAVSQYRLAQNQAAYDAIRGDVQTSTGQYAAHVGSDGLTNVTVTPNYTGDRVSVTVTGTTISLLPGVTFTVHQTSSGIVEKFENAP